MKWFSGSRDNKNSGHRNPSSSQQQPPSPAPPPPPRVENDSNRTTQNNNNNTMTDNNTSNSDNNHNDDSNPTTTTEEAVQEITSDLQHVEEQLQRPVVEGRAAFESVGSVLQSLRQRLTRSTGSAATSTSASTTTTAQQQRQQLLQRVERASLAHSHQIPLSLVEQEMERRAQPVVEFRKSATEEDNGGNGNEPAKLKDDAAHETSLEDSASSSLSGVLGSRRRRASTLMASRSRDEALQRTAQDRQLHGMGGTMETLPPLPEEEKVNQEEFELLSPETAAARLSPNRNEEEISEEDIGGDGVTLLITDRSRHRLAQSSSNIFKASTSSLSSMDFPAETTPTSKTLVYSWGLESSHSLHDTKEQRTPEQSKITEGRITRHTVLNVGVGHSHSAVVTTTGQVLLCGKNNAGQVDPMRRDEVEIVKPFLFEFPSAMTRISQVSCGGAHTAAVTQTCTVLTWGENQVGQLGHGRKSGSIPTAMVGVTRAAQVSCGNEFTAVLTTRMQLYVCGSPDVVTWNAKAVEQNEPPLPQTLPSLEGLPLVKVAAGGRHVIAVTAAGTAFAFGVNEDGCCARAFPKSIHTAVPVIFAEDNVDRSEDDMKQQDDLLSPFPHWRQSGREDEPLSLDQNLAIQDVACGESHTLLLTKTNKVFVFGKNDMGQLGVKEPCVLTATLLKAPSSDPIEDTVSFTAVAAGQYHSVLLDDKGQVWSMGFNQELKLVLPQHHIQSIYAGGQETVAVTAAVPARKTSIQREFSIQKSDDLMDHNDSTVGTDQFVVEKLMAQQDKNLLLKRVQAFFSSPSVWNSLFWDPSECAELYDQLLSSNDVAIAKTMERAMLDGLEAIQQSSARLLHPESLRFLLLFLQCPLFVNPKVGGSTQDEKDDKTDDNSNQATEYEFDSRGELALVLCESFLNLPFEGYKSIQKWAGACYGHNQHFSKYLVKPLISMLERGLMDGAGARSRVIPGAVTLLRWFHGTSQRHPSLASPQDFYSDAIGNMDPESLYEDLKKWKENGKRSGTYFLSANTFLLSPRTKRTLLMIENQVEMLRAATSNLTWDRDQHQFVFDPFFVLAIDRQHMLTQTLQKISAASHVELRKSLKIVFKGEDAVDAGGVTKEFFHLLGHQLFDISTGMWSTQYGDNITWFNGDCTWNEEGYYLVGVLTGLAVYNDVIMDVHWPRALYRRLLGYSLGLEDMVDEETKKGLQQLLDYDGDDVEDIFCLTFEHTWKDLGITRSVALKEGGADIPVTSQNKEEYVMLYVKWLLVDSVSAQYDAFERGVMQVLESSSLDLLQPEELELLLVGTPELDLDAWEKKTEYEGFDEDSPVVKNFWKFVRNMDQESKLKLLKFATGTSRAPIGGLGAMTFKIQRAGTDSDQLPTSHTCFNILILPDYGDSYEKLERLLGRAIEECEGFGLQ